MQIGELSARTGASVRMLRYYEEQGLLEPRRTGSGYRDYAESDVDRVARIRCMCPPRCPPVWSVRRCGSSSTGGPSSPGSPRSGRASPRRCRTSWTALTDKIVALQHSRDLLTQIVADVQGAVVGPGRPGEPGRAEEYTAVRKAGPAVGVAAG